MLSSTMNKSHLRSVDIAVVQGIVIYLISVLLLLPHFQYQLNPDGVSYMSIAQKYLSHDFKNAINGYWGPLFSWVMLPFLAVGLKPIISANSVLILTGLLVVLASNSVIKKFEIKSWLHFLVIDVISVEVVFFVYRAISPDLLIVLFSLIFLIQILNGSLIAGKFSGIFFGLTGAGLYFTKSFGFPFFTAIFFCCSLIIYLKSEISVERRRIIINYITGMVLFLLLSGVWIYLISNKYGHIVIGTAGTYNRALSAPNSPGPPMFYAGLIDPPNPSATSIWEDVSNLKIRTWSIFDSFQTIIFELKVFLRGSVDILKFLTEFSLIAVPLLLIIVIYLTRKGRKLIYDNLTYPVLILLILYSGYAMIAVDPRYIWLSDIIILISGAKLISLLFVKFKIRNTFRIIIASLFAASFLVMPVKSISGSMDDGNWLPVLSNSLKPLEISGRIASSENWEVTMYLSFYNNWQYFGKSVDSGEEDIEKELYEKKIDYYFVWEPVDKKMEFLIKYPEIAIGVVESLKIYKLH
jgi:hypothetical protein